MLHIFLSNHRQALIERCLLKVAQRSEPESNQTVSDYGVPIFLDQLIHTLEVEKSGTISTSTINGCNHLPMLEKPEETAQILTGFALSH